jgi:hypothetical protein
MNRKLTILLAFLLLATTAFTLQAREKDEGAAKAAAERPLSPMMAEIHALIAAQEISLTDLREQLATAADEQQAMALRRQISLLKQLTQLEILRVQVRFARQAGREDTAQRLEAAIAQITDPPPAPPPSSGKRAARERR